MKTRIFTTLCIAFLVFFGTIHCQRKQPVPTYLHSYATTFQHDPHAANQQWFQEAKLGLFIHYGLYSLLGKGEWVQYADTIPYQTYSALQNQFTARDFDAEEIVTMAQAAGFKYITFTAKHHDGFCLFSTAQTAYNSILSPAKRDLVGELSEACDKHGMGLFLYYSYAADWHHPYFYPRSLWEKARPAYDPQPNEYLYQTTDDFRKYVDYVHAQLVELLTQYKVAGIWFDPIKGFYANPSAFPIAETYALIRKHCPYALISFKQGANGTEDFMAPEHAQGALVGGGYPIAAEIYELNKGKYKEVCTTMQYNRPGGKGSVWGYNAQAEHRNAEQVRRNIQAAMDGGYNLLLNVGPLPEGGIHPQDIKAFQDLSR